MNDSEPGVPLPTGEPIEGDETDALISDLTEIVGAAPTLAMTLRRWTPILVKFASVQAIVQVLGFAAGILVVRNLPKREYAFYTLCNTMLATILLLSDSGISSALASIGGRVWQDKFRLSRLIKTALQLRNLLAAVSLPVVIPVLVLLLRQNEADALKTAVLVAAVLAGCGLELITRMYSVALRLKSEIRQIQNQALVSALVKLAVVGIAVLFFFDVEIAILAVVAGYAVQYWMLQRWASQHLDSQAPADPEVRTEILAVVRRQAPHSIYYCLQAQIVIWLIGFFGTAERVAEVGALGRLTLVFSILGSLTGDVLFPAFARIQSTRTLQKRYFQIIAGYIAGSALVVGVVALFPSQVFWVLGSRYSNLQSEGVLMACSAVLGNLSGMVWGLAYVRAWIVPPLKFIPAIIAIQAALIFALNLSTVRGVLLFSIFSAIPTIVWLVCFAVGKMRRLDEVHA